MATECKKKASILIATHNLNFGIKLAEWLASHGYQAVLIRSWLTMLEECRSLTPRAIVLDCSHREETASPGFEETLRALDAASPHAVVVVMGGPPVLLPGQKGETALRCIQTQSANFAYIGRLLHSEIDLNVTLRPRPNATQTSPEQWTQDDHLPQEERPSGIHHRTCPRCQGLMHPVDPLDPLDTLRPGNREAMQAWRCISCGNLIDPVIMRNRHVITKARSRQRNSSPRQPVYKG